MADGTGEHLIDSAEAANLLGVTVRTVQRKADTGQIPVVTRLGKRGEYVFRESDIEAIAHAGEGS